MSDDTKYFSGYYFSFRSTGVSEIDEILENIARAGKAYHGTEYWNDSENGEPSYIDLIQAAADKAAAKFKPQSQDESGEK